MSDATTPESTNPSSTATSEPVATGPVTTDGGTSTAGQLTEQPGSTFQSLELSPDGSSLAFENERGVGLVSLGGGEVSYLVENDADITATKPTYLGDGRLAVLISGPGEVGGTINIVGDDGGLQPVDLPITVLDIDGGTDDTIVYVSYADGARSIGTVQIDAASPAANPTTQGLNDHDPAISPDGTQLAFIRTDSDDAGNEVNTLFITDVTGGVEIPIIAGPQGVALRAPSWAPDGGRLVVSMSATSADGTATDQIFVIDPAVGSIQVTDDGGDKPEAVWISNDEIAYRIATSDQLDGQIFVVRAPAAG